MVTQGHRWVEAMFSRKAAGYWGILAVAAVIRGIHFGFMYYRDPFFGLLLPGGDNYAFDRWALDLSQTLFLSTDNIPFFHGPLYAYFLGFVYLRFGHLYSAAVLAQHAIGVLTTVLIYHVGRKVFGRLAGAIAGLMAAFCPLFLLYEGEILSDALILLTNTALLCLVLRAQDKNTLKAWAGVGVLLGITILGRPNNLLFLPLCFIGCGWAAVRLRALTVIGACLAVLLPICIVNYVHDGGFRITYSGPVNFYIGNASDATGVFATPPSYHAITQQENKPHAKIHWGRYLRKDLATHPAQWVRLIAKKAVLFWESGEIPHNDNYYIKRAFSPFLRIPLVFGVIAPIGLIGLLQALGASSRNRKTVLWLAGYLAVYSISIILVFVLARLRLPALAVLIVFASKPLADTLRRLYLCMRYRKRFHHLRPYLRHTAAAWIGAAMLGSLLWRPLDIPLIRWNDYYNLSGAYESRGDIESALNACREGMRAHPDSPVLKKEAERLSVFYASIKNRSYYSQMKP